MPPEILWGFTVKAVSCCRYRTALRWNHYNHSLFWCQVACSGYASDSVTLQETAFTRLAYKPFAGVDGVEPPNFTLLQVYSLIDYRSRKHPFLASSLMPTSSSFFSSVFIRFGTQESHLKSLGSEPRMLLITLVPISNISRGERSVKSYKRKSCWG